MPLFTSSNNSSSRRINCTPLVLLFIFILIIFSYGSSSQSSFTLAQQNVNDTLTIDNQSTGIGSGDAALARTLKVEGILGTSITFEVTSSSKMYQKINFEPAVCPGAAIRFTAYDTNAVFFRPRCPSADELRDSCRISNGVEGTFGKPIQVSILGCTWNTSSIDDATTAFKFEFMPNANSVCEHYQFQFTIHSNRFSGTGRGMSILIGGSNTTLQGENVISNNKIYRQTCAGPRDQSSSTPANVADRPRIDAATVHLSSTSTRDLGIPGYSPQRLGTAQTRNVPLRLLSSTFEFSDNEIQDECDSYQTNQEMLAMVYITLDFNNTASSSLRFESNQFHKIDFGNISTIDDVDGNPSQPIFNGLVSLQLTSSGSTDFDFYSPANDKYNEGIAAHVSSSTRNDENTTSSLSASSSPQLVIRNNIFFPIGGVPSSSHYSTLPLDRLLNTPPVLYYDRRFWLRQGALANLVDDSTLRFFVFQIMLLVPTKDQANMFPASTATMFRQVNVTGNEVGNFSVLNPIPFVLAPTPTPEQIYKNADFCMMYRVSWDRPFVEADATQQRDERIHLSVIQLLVSAFVQEINIEGNRITGGVYSQVPTNTMIELQNSAEIGNLRIDKNTFDNINLLRRENCDLNLPLDDGRYRTHLSSSILITGGQFSNISISNTYSSTPMLATWSYYLHVSVLVTQVEKELAITKSIFKSHKNMFYGDVGGVFVDFVNVLFQGPMRNYFGGTIPLYRPPLARSPIVRNNFFSLSSRSFTSFPVRYRIEESAISSNRRVWMPAYPNVSVVDVYLEYSHERAPQGTLFLCWMQRFTAEVLLVTNFRVNFTDKTSVIYNFNYFKLGANASVTSHVLFEDARVVYSRHVSRSSIYPFSSWEISPRHAMTPEEVRKTYENQQQQQQPGSFETVYYVPAVSNVKPFFGEYLTGNVNRFFFNNIHIAVYGVQLPILTPKDPYTITDESLTMVRRGEVTVDVVGFSYLEVRFKLDEDENVDLVDGTVRSNVNDLISSTLQLKHLNMASSSSSSIPATEPLPISIIQVANSSLITWNVDRSKLMTIFDASVVSRVAIVDCFFRNRAHRRLQPGDEKLREVTRLLADIYFPADNEANSTSALRRHPGPAGGPNVTISRIKIENEDNASQSLVVLGIRFDGKMAGALANSADTFVIDKVDMVNFRVRGWRWQELQQTAAATSSPPPVELIEDIEYGVISNEYVTFPPATYGVGGLSITEKSTSKAAIGLLGASVRVLFVNRLTALNNDFLESGRMMTHLDRVQRSVFNDETISSNVTSNIFIPEMLPERNRNQLFSSSSSSLSDDRLPVCSMAKKRLIDQHFSQSDFNSLISTKYPYAEPATRDLITNLALPQSISHQIEIPPPSTTSNYYTSPQFLDSTETQKNYIHFCGATESHSLSVSHELSQNTSTPELTLTLSLTNTSTKELPLPKKRPAEFQAAKDAVENLGLAIAVTNPVGAAKMVTVMNLVDGIFKNSCGGPDLGDTPQPAESPIPISIGEGGYQAGLLVANLILVIGFIILFVLVYYLFWIVRLKFYPPSTEDVDQMVARETKNGDSIERRRQGRGRREFRSMILRRRSKMPSVYVAAARSRSTSAVEFVYTLLTYPVLVGVFVVCVRPGIPFALKFGSVIACLAFFGIAAVSYWYLLFKRSRVEHYRYLRGDQIDQVSFGIVDRTLLDMEEKSGYVQDSDDDYSSSSEDEDESEDNEKDKNKKKEENKKELNNGLSNRTDIQQKVSESTSSDKKPLSKKILDFLGDGLEYFGGAEGEYFVPSRKKIRYPLTRKDKELFKLAEPLMEGYTDRFFRFSICECLVQAGAAVGILLAELIEDRRSGCLAAGIFTMLVFVVYLGAVLYYRPHQERILRWTIPPTMMMEVGALIMALAGGEFSAIGSIFIAIVSLQMLAALFSLAGWVTSILWPFLRKVIRRYLRMKSRQRAKQMKRDQRDFFRNSGRGGQQDDEMFLLEMTGDRGGGGDGDDDNLLLFPASRNGRNNQFSPPSTDPRNRPFPPPQHRGRSSSRYDNIHGRGGNRAPRNNHTLGVENGDDDFWRPTSSSVAPRSNNNNNTNAFRSTSSASTVPFRGFKNSTTAARNDSFAGTSRREKEQRRRMSEKTGSERDRRREEDFFVSSSRHRESSDSYRNPNRADQRRQPHQQHSSSNSGRSSPLLLSPRGNRDQRQSRSTNHHHHQNDRRQPSQNYSSSSVAKSSPRGSRTFHSDGDRGGEKEDFDVDDYFAAPDQSTRSRRRRKDDDVDQHRSHHHHRDSSSSKKSRRNNTIQL